MRWFLMVVVLLVPVSAQAVLYWKAMPGARVVIISDKYGTPGQSTAIRFFLEAHEGGDHLRAKVRLFTPKNNPVDAVTKGRCELWVNSKLVGGLGDHWIAGDNGRELWFPNLREKDRVVLGIFWDQEQPAMEYATMETENSHGTHTRIWQTARTEWFFKKEPEAERTAHFREFSLDEVCGSFTSQELIKGS